MVFIVAAVLLAAGLVFGTGFNARITHELQSNPTGDRAASIMLIRGEELEGTATVSDDTAYTYQVFERLRPDAPVWASRLAGARLVAIRLNDVQQQDLGKKSKLYRTDNNR
jgi:hypothetical protein